MAYNPRQLPPTPSASHLRKQAKARLAALKVNAPSARLAEAQHLIAREYGFANWAELLTEVERRQQSPAGQYRKIRRFALALPGRQVPQNEAVGLNHGLTAAASISIFCIMAVIGCGLLYLAGWTWADELPGLHYVTSILRKIL